MHTCEQSVTRRSGGHRIENPPKKKTPALTEQRKAERPRSTGGRSGNGYGSIRRSSCNAKVANTGDPRIGWGALHLAGRALFRGVPH